MRSSRQKHQIITAEKQQQQKCPNLRLCALLSPPPLQFQCNKWHAHSLLISFINAFLVCFMSEIERTLVEGGWRHNEGHIAGWHTDLPTTYKCNPRHAAARQSIWVVCAGECACLSLVWPGLVSGAERARAAHRLHVPERLIWHFRAACPDGRPRQCGGQAGPHTLPLPFFCRARMDGMDTRLYQFEGYFVQRHPPPPQCPMATPCSDSTFNRFAMIS